MNLTPEFLEDALNPEKNYMSNLPAKWEVVAVNPNYEVSDLGEVRNIKTGRILKQKLRNGYLAVNLSNDGKVTTYNVHRLVAEAFLDNPDNKPQINHKDEIKINPALSNLEYVTPQENIKYSRANQVIGKDIHGNIVLEFDSLAEAGRHGYFSNYIKRSFMYHLPYKGVYFTIMPPKAQEYKERNLWQ